MNIRQTVLSCLRPCQFLGKVFQVTRASRSDIGYAMKGHKEWHVFGNLIFSVKGFSNWGSESPASKRGSAASLNAGSHVGFVIIANIN